MDEETNSEADKLQNTTHRGGRNHDFEVVVVILAAVAVVMFNVHSVIVPQTRRVGTSSNRSRSYIRTGPFLLECMTKRDRLSPLFLITTLPSLSAVSPGIVRDLASRRLRLRNCGRRGTVDADDDDGERSGEIERLCPVLRRDRVSYVFFSRRTGSRRKDILDSQL